MAENGPDQQSQQKSEETKRQDGNTCSTGSRPSSAAKEDREARIKSFKERQNEERQKKLEEIKVQALAAQRYKEQREQERRLRLEELRLKEDVKRQQVEERKKAINDAERDRLESILRRNQERETRIEAKKRNERSSMVFAFGSSTPRILGPAEGSSFWGHRRATSTQNITYAAAAAPLTRRQSERELDGGSKKRATSAGGLERSGEDMRMSTSMYEVFHWGDESESSKPLIPSSPAQAITRSSSASFGVSTPQHPAGCVSGYVGRRRTDLMPTIPAKDSPSTPPRKPFARSPGRAYSMSRLDQLAKPRKRHSELPMLSESHAGQPFRPISRPQPSSVSRSMSHLAVGKLGPAPQKPLRKADSRSMHQLSAAVPMPPPRTTRATELRQRKLVVHSPAQVEGPSRPSSSLSQQSSSSITSSVTVRSRPVAAPRRPRPASIAGTGITDGVLVDSKKSEVRPPLPKTRKPSLQKSQERIAKKKSLPSPTEGSPKPIVSPTADVGSICPTIVADNSGQTPIDSERVKSSVSDIEKKPDASEIQQSVNTISNANQEAESKKSNAQEAQLIDLDQPTTENTSTVPESFEKQPIEPLHPETAQPLNPEPIEPTETRPSEPIIPSESESKSMSESMKIVEQKMVEGADGQAESEMTSSMTKPRITTEEEAKAALAEKRRLAREEAERKAEMERLRVEEETRLEFERQQREEEQQRVLIEQQRAAEDERLKEAIREAQKREEEERRKREEEQRLKVQKEEAERKAKEEADKQKAELQERLKNEEKEREARRKRVEAIMIRTRGKNNSSSPPQTEEKNAENENKIETKVNGSKADGAENGHKNGKDIETVDNIIPVDSLKNANTVTANTLSTDDTINSNDAWQRNNTQTDLLM